MKDEKKIAEEYKEMYNISEELTKREMENFVPMDKKLLKSHHSSIERHIFETYRNYRMRHILFMTMMYESRYGDADERLRIVTYIEKYLKLDESQDGNWPEVKRQILSGEYKDLVDEKTLEN